MEISRSIFGLVKSNNGFFKSEKQRDFLISKMESYFGCIGYASSGYNSCPIFAKWDERGITKITKSSKRGDVIMFERKEKGSLTSIEVKEIGKIKREIKKIQKEIDVNRASFEDGSYNGSGEKYTYEQMTVELYCHFQSKRVDSINSLKQKLSTYLKD